MRLIETGQSIVVLDVVRILNGPEEIESIDIVDPGRLVQGLAVAEFGSAVMFSAEAATAQAPTNVSSLGWDPLGKSASWKFIGPSGRKEQISPANVDRIETVVEGQGLVQK